MDGLQIIKAERERQRSETGAEGEDTFVNGELSVAAESYVTATHFLLSKADTLALLAQLPGGGNIAEAMRKTPPAYWPFAQDEWLPVADPIGNLAKAGAFIVAEIERLQRLKGE